MTDKKVKKNKRQFSGRVVSSKMDKTIVVLVSAVKRHPKYKKQYKVDTRYKVHDPKNEAKVDNRVIFEECRPLSKYKRWRLVKIIK